MYALSLSCLRKGELVAGNSIREGKSRPALLPRPLYRFIGFVFTQAWLVGVCLGRAVCFTPRPLVSLMTDAAFPACAGIAVSSAVVLVCTLRIVPLCRRRVACLLAALTCCLCSMAMACSSYGILPAGIFAPASFFAGAAAGVQVLAWQEYFATLGARCAITGMAVSSALGAVLFLICEFLPQPFGAVLFVALPILGELTRRPPAGTRFFSTTGEPISTRQLLSNMLHDYSPRMYVLCALMALAFSCGCSLTTPDLEILAGPGGAFFVVLVGLVMCAGCAAVLLTTPQRLMRLFYVALPLLMLDAAMLGWGLPAMRTVELLAGAVGVSLAYCLVWALMVSVAQSKRLATLGLIAFLHTSCFLGVVLGQLAVGAVRADVGHGSIVMLTCLGAAALLFAGFNGKVTVSEEMFSAPQGDQLECAVCDLAQECGLTPREVEVLQAWSTGHNAAYIEQNLGISRNTVKTHLNHIYQKTGTAGREELLGLLDQRKASIK